MSTVERLYPQPDDSSSPCVTLDDALAERRDNVRRLLADQRQRLSQFEQRLAEASRVSDRPAAPDHDGETIREVAQRQEALLDQVVRQLQDLERETRRPVEDPSRIAGLEQELARLHAEIERLENRHREQSEETAQARRDLDQERAAVRAAESDRRRVEEERAKTNSELDRQRDQANATSLEMARLAAELSQVRAESDRRLAEIRQTQQQQFDEHLREYFTQIDQLTRDRERLQEETHILREQARHQESELLELRAGADARFLVPAAEDECQALRAANETLRRRLEALEEAATAGEAAASSDSDLARRLELALQDCRELKAKNQELAAQAKGASAAGGILSSGSDSYDWESQKQRLLAQLENDFDEGVPQQRADKLTIQDTVRITDQVIAAKEAELEGLRRLLEDQSASIGNVAVGAAAIAQFLDQDELILQERENLRLSNEKLKELLKTTEVDLSMERATIAREKQRLEELSRQIEMAQTKLGMKEPTDGGKPANRGKWLTRLGLKENG